MNFSIVTLFPESFDSYLGTSMMKRAQARGLIDVELYNPREMSTDAHRTVDDRPFGGGPGMVLKVEPIVKTVEKIKGKRKKIVIMSPRGKQFTNTLAKTWAKKVDTLILICGHYEGIDARVKKILKAEEVSVGPYVLTGGELPAMTIIDSVSRQIPGVLGKSESLEEGRMAIGEVYTRPEIFVWKGKKYKAPRVLLSGDPKKIEEWKRGQA